MPGVVNGSLHFDAATLSPTYRFTKGIPGRSYGLAIARRLGVDRAVLAAAEALVPDAERELDRLLASVESATPGAGSRRGRRCRIGSPTSIGAKPWSRATAESQDAREATLATAGEDRPTATSARQAKAYLLEARKRVEEALALARGAADEAAAKEARRLVEEGVRERIAAARRAGRDDAAACPWRCCVGSRVRLNTGATGELAELRGDGKAVVIVGTMRLVVAARTLAPLANADAAARVRRSHHDSDR